jgi:acyl-CoA synthetase (AMP-forming)/AMP-acid ligase II
MLLHRNILANVLQNDAWMQPVLRKLPHTEQLFTVCALPLYHIFALTVCFLLGMRVGGINLLIPNPRDVPGLIKDLRKYQFHNFPGQHALQCAAQFTQLRPSRLLETEGLMQRRYGDTTGCRRRLVEQDRLRAVRGLRTVGNFTRADLQSLRLEGLQWNDRRSLAIDSHFNP